MIVGAQQPCFLPWIGYWHKLATVDKFVSMAHSQYSKGEFFNRVKIRDGSWLTVPVSYRFGNPISDVVALDTTHMINKISEIYKSDFYYYRLTNILDILNETKPRLLVDLNRELENEIFSILKITPDILTAVAGVGNSAQDRLWSMLSNTVPKMTHYYSGGGGMEYMKPPYPVPVKFQIVESECKLPIIDILTTQISPLDYILDNCYWSNYGI